MMSEIDKSYLEQISSFVEEATEALKWVEKTTVVHKTKDWQEDYGDCLFFHFNNFEEPPEVCVASILDIDFKGDYWTHFIRMDFNFIFEQVEKAGAK